jgi:ABC-type glutathione transport system ATPase component
LSAPLLQVNLRAEYGKRCVLREVRFDLHAGEALGMVGTSGAGKTTLVMSLLGLLAWRGGKATGEVFLDGVNLLTLPAAQARLLRGRRIALIPQSPMTALNPAVSLRRHFQEAWRAHEPRGAKALQNRIDQLMEEVQLPAGEESFLSRKPGQISVGQAQRVLIALALLHRPALLVADEPTSALDPVTQAEIVRLLQQLTRSHGTALLYISHDLLSVLQLCDRLAVLDQGVIVESIPVAQIEQARHPETLALLASLPVPIALLLAHSRARLNLSPKMTVSSSVS